MLNQLFCYFFKDLNLRDLLVLPFAHLIGFIEFGQCSLHATSQLQRLMSW